jgi:hypothetical protein
MVTLHPADGAENLQVVSCEYKKLPVTMLLDEASEKCIIETVLAVPYNETLLFLNCNCHGRLMKL